MTSREKRALNSLQLISQLQERNLLEQKVQDENHYKGYNKNNDKIQKPII